MKRIIFFLTLLLGIAQLADAQITQTSPNKNFNWFLRIKKVGSYWRLEMDSIGNGTGWGPISGGGNTASVPWGAITGSLTSQSDLNTALSNKVPVTRQINGYALNNNITLTKSDVGLNNVPNLDFTNPVNITQSSTYRFTTDAEKTTWNGKIGPGDTSSMLLVYRHWGIYPRLDGSYTDPSWLTITKTKVGLSNVPNLDATNPANIGQNSNYRFVTDAEKSIWSGKQDALGFTPVPNTRTVNGYPLTSNIALTKTDVGLGNVPNTDATNPANITQSSSYRFVTDAEKTTWNGKQDNIGYTTENVANKVTSFASPSNTTYPTSQAVKTELGKYQDTSSHSYITNNTTYDSISQKISDSVLQLKSIRVDNGGSNKVTVTSEITDSSLKYSVTLNEANFTGVIPTTRAGAPSGGNTGQFLMKNSNTSYDYSWGTPSGSGTVNSGTQYRLAYYATTSTAVSEAAAITGNRALISDANGVPTHSAVTNTELGYVSGVTSAIQTQLNAKAASSHTHNNVDITWSSAVDLNGQSLAGYVASVNAQTGTTYTLQASDKGKVITISNASAITVTVPSGLGAGFTCTVIQKGAGQITFSPSSTTVNNRSGQTKTAGQHAVVSLISDVANNFYLSGDTGN